MTPTPPTAIRRGPASLGRNAIVSPGQAEPVDWADVPRVAIEMPAATQAERLRDAAQQRRGTVFEIAAERDRSLQEPFRSDLALHVVGPRVRFNRELLQHMVYANSVDYRAGASWPLLDRALALGAKSTSDGVGDIQLSDGSRAWLDGGPVRYSPPIDGASVLYMRRWRTVLERERRRSSASK